MREGTEISGGGREAPDSTEMDFQVREIENVIAQGLFEMLDTRPLYPLNHWHPVIKHMGQTVLARVDGMPERYLGVKMTFGPGAEAAIWSAFVASHVREVERRKFARLPWYKRLTYRGGKL